VGRTRMKVLKMKVKDYVFILLTGGMIAGVILLNIYAKGYKL
jgi:energy-coupling factor transporter transmembrane protein EcfT